MATSEWEETALAQSNGYILERVTLEKMFLGKNGPETREEYKYAAFKQAGDWETRGERIIFSADSPEEVTDYMCLHYPFATCIGTWPPYWELHESLSRDDTTGS